MNIYEEVAKERARIAALPPIGQEIMKAIRHVERRQLPWLARAAWGRQLLPIAARSAVDCYISEAQFVEAAVEAYRLAVKRDSITK
jgi:hypothetical protein